MILSIDTATEFAGLALINKDSLWAEEIWHAGRNHTTELAPRISRMLKKAGLTAADLDGIVVSIGPGSYTGVRIGVAVAKGLALPNNIPTVGVPTLDVTAHPYRNQSLPVIAVAGAGRKRILAARYVPFEKGDTLIPDTPSELPIFQAIEQSIAPQTWKKIRPAEITTVAELAATLTEPALIVGELSEESANILRQGAKANVFVVSPIERVRRPGILAELGAVKLAAEGSADLVPVYLKGP